ncbi:hypothetical protein [Lichenicoccus roseus]|uniref:Uncharacterized protein n=1 Tax=Lichenicoccus roseus TaxID=2683649 RepID=A0A5R9J6Y2_9PROT|nr:hypothetical protein [Lichenicoccus roseus]TLU71381.1 hypothetical protein FE263_15830 [Lichenicoccus roseus]
MKTSLPKTTAAKRALSAFHSSQAGADRMSEDLLFLENWESDPAPGTAAVLRIGQIRRSNPALAAEIRRELLDLRPRRG